MSAAAIIDTTDEIDDLIRTLHETQLRLQQLTGGEIDAIVLPGGTSFLLHDAQEKLRDSEERFRSTFEQAAVGMAHVSPDKSFLRVNDRLCRITGYSREELLRLTFEDLTLPDERHDAIAASEAMLEGRQSSYNIEKRYLRKDGSIIWVQVVATLERTPDGQPNYFIAVYIDITLRKHAEAETLALAERLALATRASKVGIWDWDILSGSMHWDDQMHSLYGADPHAPHDFELWHRHLHPDDRLRADAEMQAALASDQTPFDTSFRILIPPHDSVRHIRAQGLVARDPTGLPVRMLGTNWDVTTEVLREDTLREKLANESSLLQKALAGEKAKSEFLAVMSHEIRTPISGLLGFAEMLSHSPSLTAEDRDLNTSILANGGGLLRILDDILDFSILGAGHLTIERQPFSPRQLVREIKALFKRQIHEKGLTFSALSDDSLPRIIDGDAGRIRQILINLLGNALKFTAHGSIHLDARSFQEQSGEGVIAFSVRDTGSGIPADKADLIFDPFVQADSSISRRHGGTGLGLAISRRLAELMGGELLLVSLAEGTLFTLRLPLIHVTAPASDPCASPPSPPTSLNTAFARTHPLRILVVDDDKINRRLILNILGKLGYDPLSAHDGMEALDLFAAEPFDCILMDIQMPGMDGIEATRNIRTRESSLSLPPVFISALTANILPIHQDQCLEAGMNAYLNKPIKIPAVRSALAKAHAFRSHLKMSRAN